MPSVRIDSSPLIAGACVVSAYPGHGIRGADVPSTGTHGAAILYAGLSLPAEADDEFRLLILTRPAGIPGLVIREDSSVEVPEDTPAGSYGGTMRGYKNGAVFGTDPQTYTITVGEAQISGDAVIDEPSAGGGLESAAELTGDATIDEPTAGGGASSAAEISGDAVADGPTAGGGLASAPDSSIAGDAVVDEPTAGGGAESAAEVTGGAVEEGPAAAGGAESAAQVSGDAAIDEPTAGGGLASDGPAGMSGDAVVDEPTAAGGLESAAEVSGGAVIEEPTAAGGAVSLAGTPRLEELLTAVLRTVCPRVSPDVAPLDTPRPYVTYQQIGGQSWRYIDLTPADNRHAIVQINVWADTRRDARNLIQAIEDALCSATSIVADPMSEPQSDSTELTDRTVYGSLQDYEIVAPR